MTHRRVAALYDIHGHLPALEATLAAIEAAHVDLIVVGGDVALGPMPRECLARVEALGDRAVFIRGNCDRHVVDAFDGRPLDALPAPVRESVQWTAAQLDRAHRDLLADWPMVVDLGLDPLGRMTCCHATPRRDDELVTARTPDDALRTMLEHTPSGVVLCGHTHMQLDRTVDAWRVVNAGSVGLPFADRREAHWALLGPDVVFHRTPYDVEDAERRIRATGFPRPDDVLHPMTEAEALARFSPA